MPKLFIPPLGTILRLEEDWHFQLHEEGRNSNLIDSAKITPPYRDQVCPSDRWRNMSLADRSAAIDLTDWKYTPHEDYESNHEYSFWSGDWEHPFVFRAETELTVDRIYIRQGGAQFNSITFRSRCWMSQLGDPMFGAPRKLKTIRFWAKLDDVNNMVAKIVEPR